jgi:hypothetical protein
MASKREIVRLSGFLSGQGQEATCTIEALQVTLPGGGTSALARQKIVSVSKTLPEGYQLSTNGGPPSPVRYSDGQWLVLSPTKMVASA